MGFWSSFKDIALPAAGAIVGGGLGSDYGDVGRIVGAGLGGAGGSALAGNDLKNIALTGALSAGGSAALPWLAGQAGINSTGLNFLDNSFGLPGQTSPAALPGFSAGGGGDFSGNGGQGTDWDADSYGTLQPGEQEYTGDDGLLHIGAPPATSQLDNITGDLGLGSNLPEGMAPTQMAQDFAAQNAGNITTPGYGTGGVIGTGPTTTGDLNIPWANDLRLDQTAQDAMAAEKGGQGISGILNSLGIGKSAILPGLALGYSAYKNTQESPEAAMLRKQAEAANQSGAALQQYLTTGTLPAGAQASLDQATNAAKQRIRSQYASNNLSGSSMERDALNNVDLQSKAQAGQIAAQLMDTGVKQSGMSSNIYEYLLRSQDAADQSLGQAIAQFSAASVPARKAA